MQSNMIHFAKKTIARLAIPNVITTYHDDASRGLKLVVRPTGTKTFILYRKINGKPERITLGRFPDLSIEQARAKADQYNSEIAVGKNPAKEKRNIKDAITFGSLFQKYLERHARIHKRSWKKDVELFNGYCKPLVKRQLININKTDIQRLHNHIGSYNGIYIANRVLSLLHALFAKAIEWGWEYPNPVTGIKKFKETSRDRFLQADELPRLFDALKQEPNATIRDFIFISLFTGARKSNVMAMRWEQINFSNSTWTIPLTKNGESHTVPLVEAVLEILKARRIYSKNDWVFPGNGVTGHLVEPKKTWKRILERANISNLRLHDLRRSLGSWQAVTGASLTVIGKTLAHKNVSTTAIYARLNLDPVRDSMNKATQAMLDTSQ